MKFRTMVISNKEKSQEITNKHQNEWIYEFIESNNLSKEDRNQIRFKLYDACNEMAEWKDEQMKRTLVEFTGYLNKRGFFCDSLCFDTEHQVDTFIELQKKKR